MGDMPRFLDRRGGSARGIMLSFLPFGRSSMQAPSPLPLNEWSNFYVIIGSSAGALTGLQFVVIALVAQAQATGSMGEIRAFGTPTVVHFCAALLISAILSAPWHTLPHVGWALVLCGAAGV